MQKDTYALPLRDHRAQHARTAFQGHIYCDFSIDTTISEHLNTQTDPTSNRAEGTDNFRPNFGPKIRPVPCSWVPRGVRIVHKLTPLDFGPRLEVAT